MVNRIRSTLALQLLLLTVTACGGAVDPAPAPAPTPPSSWEPYPACDCGWSDDPATGVQSCGSAFELKHTDTVELVDNGASVCHVYEDTCTDATRPDCAHLCLRTHATCEPTTPHGLP